MTTSRGNGKLAYSKKIGTIVPSRLIRILFVFGLLCLVFGGRDLNAQPQGADAMPMKIESPSFAPGAELPMRYTGEGDDVSPPLAWSGLPFGTKSLVLIVDDPDAPDPAAPKMTFVHWVVFNIPPMAPGFAEGIKTYPEGAHEGLNDRRRPGWTGPQPPIGRHRYFFKLYALDTRLELRGAPSKPDIEQAMEGHILSEATLVGTYQSKK